MAIQCTTCGTQTRQGAKFCHACGTPIATAPLPSTLPLPSTPPSGEIRPVAAPTAPQPSAATEAMDASAAYIPQTPQTYQPPPFPVAAPPKSNKTLRNVLISLAIIMVLGMGLLAGGVYFAAKKAQQKIQQIAEKGFPVSNDPASVPDEKLGVPVYPGAKRENTAKASFGAMSGAVVTFSTEDEVNEVADFYRDYFKGKKNQRLNEISNSDDSNSQETVVFQVGGDEGDRLITITPDGKNSNRTQIVILLGKGLPGLPVPPPPPPPPPGVSSKGAAAQKAQELEKQALEQAEKVLRDLKDAAPPPPPPKR